MRFSNLVGGGDKDADALLRAAFQQTRMAMVATDPRREDNPIVLINPAFEKLTGYPEDEVIGRNCRFLQGDQTRDEAVGAISEAIDQRRWGYFEIRNYRKDGTPFWNALHVSPVYNDEGELIYFFGSQWDVSDRREVEQRLHLVAEELAHRIRNLFGLVLGIVGNTDAHGDTEAFREEVSGRLRALVDAHESLFRPVETADSAEAMSETTADLHDVVHRVLAPYDVELEGPTVAITDRAALDLALALHELATNAVKHGALSVPEGRTTLSWRRTQTAEGGIVLLDWSERGGPSTKRPDKPGFGMQLLAMIAQGNARENAGLDYTDQGLDYRFALPESDAPGERTH